MTGPFGFLSRARFGQAEAQPGATQCMHCDLAKRAARRVASPSGCCRSPAPTGSTSKRFTTVSAVVVVSRLRSRTPGPSGGAGRRFFSAQAASQARQPAHRVVSTRTEASSAPGVSDPPGSSPRASAGAARAAAPAAPATSRKLLRLSFIGIPLSSPVRRIG